MAIIKTFFNETDQKAIAKTSEYRKTEQENRYSDIEFVSLEILKEVLRKDGNLSYSACAEWSVKAAKRMLDMCNVARSNPEYFENLLENDENEYFYELNSDEDEECESWHQ